MTRNVRLGLALAAVLLAAACGEMPTQSEVRREGAIAAIQPGTCTNLAELNQLAAVLFTPGSQPNINSVRGKLKNLDLLVRKGKIAEAKAQAGEIVAFTLKKHNQGGLSGTADDVEAFSDKVLCFAGIDIDVEEPTNSFLIMPADTAQVITNTTGTAGIAFPANPVFEPTLVTIDTIPDTYPAPGAGPLSTKLDQYPGFIQITKTSATNAPLAKPVVVGVCAAGAIPADVRDRLRLGHQASAGFEVTPAASATFLSCPIQTAEAPASTAWDRLVDLVLPQKAHAFQATSFGGGVGGTVTEFSPFAPVDPVLSFGGGVGGTVTEFIRMPGTSKVLAQMTGIAALTGPCASPIEGAMGSPVRDECRPYVTITTRLGTPFSGVPVTWDVTQGGGQVAANTGTCGTFGPTAATTTGVNGGAGVCWTLGSVGANQVRATPALGGDAVPGVSFSQSQVLFDAIANGPAALVWSLQPAPVVPAFPGLTAQVTVVDKNGERVFGSADRVFVTLNQGTFRDGQAELALKAVQGLVNVAAVVPTPGTGYRLLAAAPFGSPALPSVASTPFDVVPGAPFNILAIEGTGVTAAAGSVLTPKVRVIDRVGNVVPGATVAWSVVPESPGSVTPATSVTDAAGEATATWTIGLGLNGIRARLTSGSLLYVTLTATGTAP